MCDGKADCPNESDESRCGECASDICAGIRKRQTRYFIGSSLISSYRGVDTNIYDKDGFDISFNFELALL